jgi:hypothetical protein
VVDLIGRRGSNSSQVGGAIKVKVSGRPVSSELGRKLSKKPTNFISFSLAFRFYTLN